MNFANQQPVWMPLGQASRRLGLTPRAVVAEARAGRLPLRVAQFGARGVYRVASVDLAAYVARIEGQAQQ